MRFLWAWLLLILAVPLAVLAVTAPIEMGGETHTNLFLALGAACFVLGFGIAAIFGIRNDRLRKKSEVVSKKIQQRDASSRPCGWPRSSTSCGPSWLPACGAGATRSGRA